MAAAKAKVKRNTLSDFEVAIIKGLLNAGTHSNQEIAGLINRSRGDAASDISSGRISNIKNGDIKKYAAIAAASDAEIEEFLKQDASPPGEPLSPIDPKRLDALLPVKTKAPLVLAITETDQIECKKSFTIPMKTVAAFANNKGGYLVFGVENKTFAVVGLDNNKFEEYDLNKFNQNIRDTLGIGLELYPCTYFVDGKKLGIIYIAPAHTKPVITIHNAGDMAQGHIYYRYPGEDRLISPADLQNLIEGRIRQLSETILTKHIHNILRFGVENSAVMNLNTGETDGKAGSFLIDEALLPKISFVKEGEFVEKSGAPALKLIGDVEATKAAVAYTQKEALHLYPLTYKDVMHAVKGATGVKASEIDAVIKHEKVKSNQKYSYYAFRNKAQLLKYQNDGIVPIATASNYNQAAIDFIIGKIVEKKV